jgi:peroxiredoxin
MQGWSASRILFAVSLLTACCLAFSCSSVPSQGPVARGDIAPDFTCNDQAGKQQQLSALRGKVVLVNFWATWCAPCREELPSLQALKKKFPSADLVILALSTDDSWEPINKFMAQHQFTIPVYADFDKRISSRYGTFMYPETFLVDKQGRVAYKVIGAIDWTSPEIVKFLKVLILEGKP